MAINRPTMVTSVKVASTQLGCIESEVGLIKFWEHKGSCELAIQAIDASDPLDIKLLVSPDASSNCGNGGGF